MSDGVLARRLPQSQPPRHGQAGRREAGAGGPRVTQGTAPNKLRWHLLVWKMPRPRKGAEKLFRTQRQERSCLRTVRQPCLTGDFRQKFCFGGTKASVRCGMLPASCPRRCRVGVGGAARTPLPAAEGFGRSGPWALQRALLEYLKYPGPITKLGKITQMTDGVDQSPPTNFRRLRNYLQGAPQSSRHSCTPSPSVPDSPAGSGSQGGTRDPQA